MLDKTIEGILKITSVRIGVWSKCNGIPSTSKHLFVLASRLPLLPTAVTPCCCSFLVHVNGCLNSVSCTSRVITNMILNSELSHTDFHHDLHTWDCPLSVSKGRPDESKKKQSINPLHKMSPKGARTLLDSNKTSRPTSHGSSKRGWRNRTVHRNNSKIIQKTIEDKHINTWLGHDPRNHTSDHQSVGTHACSHKRNRNNFQANLWLL